MDNLTDFDSTIGIIEKINATIYSLFEDSSITYFPYIASVLTILFTLHKASLPTLRLALGASKCSYKTVKFITVTILNVIFRLFGIKEQVTVKGEFERETDRILEEMKRLVEMINKLTTREIEQLELLKRINERLNSEETNITDHAPLAILAPESSFETNMKNIMTIDDWKDGRNPYEPETISGQM
uniref:Non-structural glycoprotein 4 n=1 Tax=Rotavirus A TaxID=28875 RepID=A0A8D5ZC12_9REOV|nr:non-structural glycoprotein 4 [Rotavirus A]